MHDRAASVRIAWGLAAIAFTLLLLPLAINLLRGGAGGVGVDPRVQGTGMIFAITFADVGTEGPLDGRIYLAVSRSAQPEPRFQAAGAATGTPGAFLFSRAVVGWRARRAVELTDSDVGAPLPSIAHIPAGYYWVQAVLDRQGNGGADDVGSPADSSNPFAGDWNRRPGNLVSRPVEVFIDPRSDDVIRVHLARTVTPTGSAEPPPR